MADEWVPPSQPIWKPPTAPISAAAQPEEGEPGILSRAYHYAMTPLLPESDQTTERYFGADIPGIRNIWPGGIRVPSIRDIYEEIIRPLSSPVGLATLAAEGGINKMGKTPKAAAPEITKSVELPSTKYEPVPVTRVTRPGDPLVSDKLETWLIQGHLSNEDAAKVNDMYTRGKGTVHRITVDKNDLRGIDQNMTDEFGNKLATIDSAKLSKSIVPEARQLGPAKDIQLPAGKPLEPSISESGYYQTGQPAELLKPNRMEPIGEVPLSEWKPPTPPIPKEEVIANSSLPPEKSFNERLANWYNARQASNVVGESTRRQFSGLDTPEGDFSSLTDYQTNPNQPKYAGLQDLFGGMRENEIQAGLNVGNKENYLTQLWQESPEEIRAKMAGADLPEDSGFNQIINPRLSTRPSFTFPSIIRDYEFGINAGLTPRYSNLSEIAGWRARASSKAIADIQFWNSMKEAGEISPTPTSTNTTALDPNYTPTIPGAENRRVWYASPEVATKIKNVLQPADEGALLKIGSMMKNAALSVGVPGTNIAPHSFNILSRTISQPKFWPNILKGMISPRAGTEAIDMAIADGTLNRAVRNGMTFSSEEHLFPRHNLDQISGNRFVNMVDNVINSKLNIFKTPMFDTLVPSAKLNIFKKVEQQLISNGLEAEEASKTAAHFSNEIIGGLNLKELGEDPQFQKAARLLLFGGDWMRSSYKLGENITKSLWNFNDPTFAPYRGIATGLLTSYIAGNALNKYLSGHYMFQNDSTHQFDIETGKKDANGKSIAFGFMGGGLAIGRVLGETAMAVLNNRSQDIPRILESPLSPIANVSSSLVFNRDFAGRPLYGADKYGRPIKNSDSLENVGKMLTEHTMPNTIPLIYDWLQGKASGLHAAIGVTGAPVRFYTPTNQLQQKPAFRLQP